MVYGLFPAPKNHSKIILYIVVELFLSWLLCPSGGVRGEGGFGFLTHRLTEIQL